MLEKIIKLDAIKSAEICSFLAESIEQKKFTIQNNTNKISLIVNFDKLDLDNPTKVDAVYKILRGFNQYHLKKYAAQSPEYIKNLRNLLSRLIRLKQACITQKAESEDLKKLNKIQAKIVYQLAMAHLDLGKLDKSLSYFRLLNPELDSDNNKSKKAAETLMSMAQVLAKFDSTNFKKIALYVWHTFKPVLFATSMLSEATYLALTTSKLIAGICAIGLGAGIAANPIALPAIAISLIFLRFALYPWLKESIQDLRDFHKKSVENKYKQLLCPDKKNKDTAKLNSLPAQAKKSLHNVFSLFGMSKQNNPNFYMHKDNVDENSINTRNKKFYCS